MDYRNLGTSGVKVSPLCLGTMMFGDQTALEEASRIVASARDAGVNFVDTADVYAKGESERIVGKLIKQDRTAWVLATKVANPMPGTPHRVGDPGPGQFKNDPNRRGTSRKWILQAVEESLSRLGTDYIDLYYIHRDPGDVPMEETVRAMGDLIHEGKIRYWGVSNLRGWRIADAVRACDALGVPRPVACQPYYNMMNRQPENDILPACGHYGIGVVPYSPLARGVLSGKYKPGEKPAEGTRAGRNDKRMMETEFREESLVIAQKLKAQCDMRGMTTTDFAVAWVLRNRFVTSVIGGPRTFEQWHGYLASMGKKLTDEDEVLVDSWVRPGHPSTPGYNDPNYPLQGRPV
jgi:aryl-alcohol dehydrogenase-like predicted oxidoreductase